MPASASTYFMELPVSNVVENIRVSPFSPAPETVIIILGVLASNGKNVRSLLFQAAKRLQY
jgi:hypothetical protein